MFHPFPGWLYAPGIAPDPGDVTSPPYDVISPEERDTLFSRSPYNIVRLLLPGSEPDDYARAGAQLADWKRSGVLSRDDSPRFYLYVIDYRSAEGRERRARGIVGALDLVELGDLVVPHEETMHRHRRDRMALLETTESNLDPIIALSPAPGFADLVAIPGGKPRLRFEERDGSVHSLYDVADPTVAAEISRTVGSHPVSIADGHHRYTTALEYGRRRDAAEGGGPWNAIMAFVAPAEGSGLTIGPYHRVLPRSRVDSSSLAESFDVSPAPRSPPERPGDVVLADTAGSLRLTPTTEALASLPPPWREASTAVARELLYPLLGVAEDDIRYTADAAEALAVLDSEDRTVLLVAPVSEHAVASAGELGLRFPTKSTYFTPKPRAGLVVRCFGETA